MEPACANENENVNEGDKIQVPIEQDNGACEESTSTVLDYVHKQVESVSYEINKVIDARKDNVSFELNFFLTIK